VQCDLLDYDLPPELIATRPPEARDGARLCVVDVSRAPGAVEHRWVRELDALIPEGALIVVNDTRVLPARLFGKKAGTGGRVELLLVRRISDEERWSAMGRASKALRPGAEIEIDGEPGALRAKVEARDEEGGLIEVTLSSPAGRSVAEAIEAAGHVPLPPYLRRDDDASDRVRYQTVFARAPGAVAAPTAGLHLSEALLERLEQRGVELASVTLHVGLGTFQPVTASDLDHHKMHAEQFSVPRSAAAAIERARARGAPVVAVGTTVVRSLESAADPDREGLVLERASAETRLLIQPGYRFRVVDMLVTNFHLPRSTLLALVFAFAGRERVLAAYRAAIDARYRFYSYGDAMLITRPGPFDRRQGSGGER
jgi:S-adenosylmethionine:tRNA ribosyltransferase-isomerase